MKRKHQKAIDLLLGHANSADARAHKYKVKAHDARHPDHRDLLSALAADAHERDYTALAAEYRAAAQALEEL